MTNIEIDSTPTSIFRFLAVISVVFIHYSQDIRHFWFFSNVFRDEHGAIFGGAIITFFFILSGFGLFVGYQKREIANKKSFFFKRSIKILPFYYIALFLMLIIQLMAGRFSFFGFLLSFFCVQSWFPGFQHAVNPPSWFVANLLFFYAVFPAILSWIKNQNPNPFVLVFGSLVVWGLSLYIMNRLVFYYPETSKFIYCFPISHFSSFFMGICGAYFVLKKEYLFKLNYSIYSLMLLTVLFLLLTFHYQADVGGYNAIMPFEASAGLYSPLILLIVVNLSIAKNVFTMILKYKLFYFLGSISYAIYIFQAPLYSIYGHFFSKSINIDQTTNFTIFLVVIVAFSCFVTFIEPHVVNFINFRLSKKMRS